MGAIPTPPLNRFSEEERVEIAQQLERLVADTHFKQSRRYPSFLRYIIAETLAGHTDRLKERTLGIEVFGKEASYDTGTEPIVRVTAAEIRKRIALYYQNPAHQDETRVSLPPGSYVPQFEFRSRHTADAIDLVPVRPVLAPVPVAAQPEKQRASSWAYRLVITACVLFCITALSVAVWHRAHGTALDTFWSPLLKSGDDPVLFAVADQTGYGSLTLRDAADPKRQVQVADKLTAVVIDDLSTVTKLTGIVGAKGRRYTLQGESVTTLNNLRTGPSILVGAFDNEWSLRMLAPLRFHFTNDPQMSWFSIVDARPGGHAPWTVNRAHQLATNNYEDYAIVARFIDPTTGQPTLIAAGIGRGGTIAAGEFLTSPDLLREVVRQMGDPENRNVEVVLTTRIIDGEPGTPTVSAVHTW